MAEIPERTADAGVTPRRVFLRHANDESNDVPARSGASGTPVLASVVLPSNESPIPAEDGVRLGEGSKFAKLCPSQELPRSCEPPSLGVVEPRLGPAELLAEDPVFLDRAGQRLAEDGR
jgi:hypothetical protein